MKAGHERDRPEEDSSPESLRRELWDSAREEQEGSLGRRLLRLVAFAPRKRRRPPEAGAKR